jgi:uncharacterized protein (TIGR02217 family)
MILNDQLDPCFAYGFTGGPEFLTRITGLRSGHERRNADWAQARHRFSAPFQNISPEMYRALKRMFMACRGQLHGFLLADPLDSSADAESLGTAPSGTTAVQLQKTFTVDGESYVHTITRPDASVVVYEGGVAKAGTLDTTTGEFTPDSAWSGGTVTWTGPFYIPVRFASDWLPMSYETLRAISGSVDLIEVIGE